MLTADPAVPHAATFIEDVSAYLRPEDIEQLERAYLFSEQAHEGQFRKSGEPYISHPVAVADILAKLRLDPQALTAALLHDVMEDTPVSKEDIAARFGKPVAELVDGVSKLDRIEFQTYEDAQAENFRKMILAMARDVRVILIKLADRLHNMRTLGVMAEEKRSRIARETLEIYAPIANRLGLNDIYQELEDLAFRHLHPNRYGVLAKAVRAARGNRREVVGRVLDALKSRLADARIEAQVTGREKHLHSIHRKMHEKSMTFAQVHDIYGFRVIVQDTQSCYLALGALHALYKPIPGKFKDYIAIPKANGYQSLHTTLFGPFGVPVEIQIRTQQMHRLAEAGVASHWLYKSNDIALSELQKKTHQWLQSLLEMQSDSGDAAEFLEHVKIDLFPDEVYVFTPKGRIMALPRGATAVDFAYAVHTDVGNRCVAVKINHQLLPLRSELRNGDHVEIITTLHARPNPAWLNFVATGRARARIRHFLKTAQFEDAINLGERLLNQAIGAHRGSGSAVPDAQWERFLREAGVKTRREVLSDIGLGKRLAAVVARRLLPPGEVGPSDARATGGIVLRGNEGLAVQLSACCRPIPGDPIVAIINKGQGLVVHTHDCQVLAKLRPDPHDLLDTSWDPENRRLFPVTIRLIVKNERGVLAKVAAEIAGGESNIDNVGMEPDEGDAYTAMNFTLEVTHRQHLARIMRALRLIPEVVRITRVKG
jgi:GTP pyrophosphokinase